MTGDFENDRSDDQLVQDAIGALQETRQQLEKAQVAVATQLVWLKLRIARREDQE